MKKRYIYIIIVIAIVFGLYNKVFYTTNSFGSFEVIDKERSDNNFEIVIDLIDGVRDQTITINKNTRFIDKDKKYKFTSETWDRINSNTKYHMDIQKNRFPVSIFKGEYSLNLLYLN